MRASNKTKQHSIVFKFDDSYPYKLRSSVESSQEIIQLSFFVAGNQANNHKILSVALWDSNVIS